MVGGTWGDGVCEGVCEGVCRELVGDVGGGEDVGRYAGGGGGGDVRGGPFRKTTTYWHIVFVVRVLQKFVTVRVIFYKV